MPVNLTFYSGGVNEVGSNKILLDDNDTRILPDFGKGFSRTAINFEGYLSPKIANGIADFIETVLIPDVERIYGEDLLEMAGRLPWIEPAQKGCGGQEEKGICQLLFFIASSGAGRLRPNPKPEPGDIVLYDADGKIGSYSYYSVRGVGQSDFSVEPREILGRAGALTHVAY